jgi:hypothetical protein
LPSPIATPAPYSPPQEKDRLPPAWYLYPDTKESSFPYSSRALHAQSTPGSPYLCSPCQGPGFSISFWAIVTLLSGPLNRPGLMGSARPGQRVLQTQPPTFPSVTMSGWNPKPSKWPTTPWLSLRHEPSSGCSFPHNGWFFSSHSIDTF